MLERSVRFEPIDLEAHRDVCVRFRRDSFVASFGTDEAFSRESGPDGEIYVDWLRARVAEFADGCVHLWRGREIIGQLEMRVREQRVGYVHLFYLVPEARGTGIGALMHEHALGVLRQHGADVVQLSVSPTNARAVRYYQKHGWRDLGPRPGHEEVHLMERTL